MTGHLDANFQGYRLLEPLGPVTGCNVFKAVSARGDEVVAIKIFPLEISRNRPLLEKLRISFQSASRLDHPSILPIKNFSVHAGRPYVVMPFMETGSLEDRIECGVLQAMNAEAVIGGIASALELAHSKGLVHGNLMPSYILFDEDGKVQLNGLGETALRRSRAYRSNTTQDGSFDFRAPEVKAGGDITPLADQYSLGLIALQMMTNLPIEVAASSLEMIKNSDRDQITRTNPFVLDLSKRMMAVLLRALSGDPAKRFPSIQVMYQAFVAAFHNEDFRLESKPEAHPKPRSEVPVKRKRSRLVVFAPIIALAGFLIIVIPALSSGGNSPLNDLKSLLGFNTDRNSGVVNEKESGGIGGVDLGTATMIVKDPITDDVQIKATGISTTPTVFETSGSSASDPPDTPAPPVKTNPPNQQADPPPSSDQPTMTITPTPTPIIMETETSTPLATATEVVPTDPPPEESLIDPAKCNKKEGHKFYCTPTP